MLRQPHIGLPHSQQGGEPLGAVLAGEGLAGGLGRRRGLDLALQRPPEARGQGAALQSLGHVLNPVDRPRRRRHQHHDGEGHHLGGDQADHQQRHQLQGDGRAGAPAGAHERVTLASNR